MKTTLPTNLFTAIFLLGLPIADARGVKLTNEGVVRPAAIENEATVEGRQAEEVVASGESGVVRAGGIPGLGGLRAKGADNPNADEDNENEEEAEEEEEEEEEEQEEEEEAEEKSGNSNDNEVPFYCDLDVVFFDGQGLEPKGTEVKTLIKKTEEWMTTVLEPDESFQKFTIDKDATTAYDLLEPDNFSLKFSAHAQVKKNSETKMTIDDVAARVENASYEEYIKNFLWLSVPLKLNEFYQTHAVELSCRPGERPANEEARRLRGAASTAFGGSHMAAAHHDA